MQTRLGLWLFRDSVDTNWTGCMVKYVVTDAAHHCPPHRTQPTCSHQYITNTLTLGKSDTVLTQLATEVEVCPWLNLKFYKRQFYIK